MKTMSPEPGSGELTKRELLLKVRCTCLFWPELAYRFCCCWHRCRIPGIPPRTGAVVLFTGGSLLLWRRRSSGSCGTSGFHRASATITGKVTNHALLPAAALEVEGYPYDRALLDDVEDKPVVLVIDAQRPVSGDCRDGIVEFITETEAHVPVDVGAATAH